MDMKTISLSALTRFTAFCAFITVTSSLICPRYCHCDRRERSISCSVPYTYTSLPVNHVPQSVRSFGLINQSLFAFNDSWSSMNLDLREIRTINCFIYNMSHDALRGFGRLRVLHLDMNYLTEIPYCVSNSSSIRDLRMSENSIQELPPGIFDNLTQLRILQLAGNYILQVPSTTFQLLSELRVLNLSDNRIRAITKWTFANLTKLTDLDLSKNEVTNLNFGWLDSLTNLWVLKLSDFFGEVLLEDRELETNLLGLSEGLEFENLESLDISKNSLTEIPCYRWGTMTTLFYLTMDENNFNFVNGSCFSELGDLHELRINNANISVIETCAFCNMNHLHSLDLGNNFISFLPRRIFENSKLIRILKLDENYLTYLSDDFLYLPFLENLYLMKNEIRNISEFAFRSMPSLILLDLKGNKLTSITTEFWSARSLRYIQLVRNKIRYVDEEAFSNCTFIQVIFLAENRITTMKKETLTRLRHLQKVTLEKNKWECDCNLRWMHHDDKSIPKSRKDEMHWIRDLHDVRCASPERFKRHHIHAIKYSHNMICSSFPPPLTIKLIVNISLAIVGLSTALYIIQLYCKARKVERHSDDIGKCLCFR